jgi:putative phage-type endonuclease
MTEQLEQRSDAWYQARVGKITASNVGAILGVSPYSTADDVMRSMVRDHFDAEREFKGNIATQWGEDHEAEAIAALERDQGVFVEACGLIVHPKHEWLGASPDGLVGDDTVIEVKCPFKKEMFNLSTRPDYMAQVQIQMACAKREFGLFGVWVPEYIEVTEVLYDGDWFDEALPKLKEFHDSYLAIIADDELAEPYLEDLIQDMSDDEWINVAADYETAKDSMEYHKKAMAIAKERLVELAQGRKSKGGGVLVYPIKGRQATDYKAMLADNPSIDTDDYKKTGAASWGVK